MIKKFTKRILCSLLILLSVLSSFSAVPTMAAENYNGGWAMVSSNQTVWNNTSSSKSAIGTVYAHEGITVLSTSGNTAYIEYSTPNGAKRGYLINPSYYYNETSNTCVARVNSGTNTYYSNSTSSAYAGSVSTGEYVAVLAKEGSWAYVEYNTSLGRKRAYMPFNNLTCYNRPSYFPDFYQSGQEVISVSCSKTTTIYGGPSEQYATIGSVDSNDGWMPAYKIYDINGQTHYYIKYYVGSQVKYGYLL